MTSENEKVSNEEWFEYLRDSSVKVSNQYNSQVIGNFK